MGKMITGSICLTDLFAKAKEGHSAFSKAKNGKLYCNILVWENDTPDQYGNDFSIQLNPKKDASEAEKKQYIGNMKRLADGPGNVAPADLPSDEELNDLPF
jgi:hypothetical protein